MHQHTDKTRQLSDSAKQLQVAKIRNETELSAARAGDLRSYNATLLIASHVEHEQSKLSLNRLSPRTERAKKEIKLGTVNIVEACRLQSSERVRADVLVLKKKTGKP